MATENHLMLHWKNLLFPFADEFRTDIIAAVEEEWDMGHSI